MGNQIPSPGPCTYKPIINGKEETLIFKRTVFVDDCG